MSGAVTTTTLPEHVAKLAEACACRVHGWEDETVLVEGIDINYMGTRAEVIAYLTAWQQCIELKLAQQISAETDSEPLRRALLVFDSGKPIDPGQIAQVVVRPLSRMFRGARIAIPARIAERFQIDEIKVGNRSMMDRSQSIPGDTFAIRIEDAPLFAVQKRAGDTLEICLERSALAEFGRAFYFEPCLTAMDMTLYVTNCSTEAERFVGMVLGQASWNFTPRGL